MEHLAKSRVNKETAMVGRREMGRKVLFCLKATERLTTTGKVLGGE